jgi:hypothetical protein
MSQYADAALASAEAQVAAARNDPAARLALIVRTYHGPTGRAPQHLPFRRAALSFMRWQAHRGVLNPLDASPRGSVWWRAVNERLLRDGCEAVALVGAGLVDLNAGVYPAEQWNPATGQWRTLAAMQITRQYHSTALLLPDRRVLSSGGGICGTCDQVGYLAKNAEIFSPPYLFQADGTLATRPVIDAAPASTSYGVAMEIATGNTASIRKVALVRLGAVTHSDNMEQRYIPLSFSADATSISATAPANANVAPPGPYMLFIIDANGVPSVARMVSVQGDSPPVVTLTQPTNGATFTAPATVNLAATASDADGSVTKVEFFNGSAKLGEDTTAPYSFTWRSVAAGTYTLTARATDNLGARTTSAASTITVSASSNTPPTANITYPADGAMFAWKPTITITATASDPDGNVTKVEFRDSTTVLGQDTSAPYSFTWRNVPPGSHQLTARATDNAGAVTTSSQVGITVRPKR